MPCTRGCRRATTPARRPKRSVARTAVCRLLTARHQAIRDNLGEMNVEYRQHIAGRYETLKRDGWFDFCIASDLPRVADTADDLLRRLAR